MVAPIKQIVTVGAEGRIEIPRSELAPGTRVEVNVVPQPAEKPEQNYRDSFLENLDKLQKMMKLDRAAAEKWMEENRELRRGLGSILIHLATNFLISLLNSGSSEDRRIRIARRDGEAVNISVMAWAEFLCGPVSQDELSIANALLPRPEALVVEDAELAGELYNQTGRRRGSLGDCLIAACYMRVGAQLATNNLGDFRGFEVTACRYCLDMAVNKSRISGQC